MPAPGFDAYCSIRYQFRFTYKNLQPSGNMRVSPRVVDVDFLREKWTLTTFKNYKKYRGWVLTHIVRFVINSGPCIIIYNLLATCVSVSDWFTSTFSARNRL